jgi:serine/threonine protein kinase/tetratricopeptide (TPR) repeat protein
VRNAPDANLAWNDGVADAVVDTGASPAAAGATVVTLNRVESIFTEALTHTDPAARAAYLAGACGDDAALRQQVERLLAVHDSGENLLPDPIQDEASLDLPVGEGVGSTIGRYKLLEQIGEGGFGVVFMAEQSHPVRRRVALKIIKLGMDTKQVVARFQAERQALAMMDHASIARVFDAGSTDTGRPYFVMELVRGVPITTYGDQHQLKPRQRLDLFLDVCSAVQHAHQKGIIHRDLKPSNILVTMHDQKPVVKIIDFGVAKAVQGKLTDGTLFTGFRQMVGTPAYMSPEQAEMNGGLDVDTRSDVYSLGVLLYELLTGVTPVDAATLRAAAYDEMRRIIREVDPPAPSARLSSLADATQTQVAQRRQTDPQRLLQSLRGDLDWIVMRCLEKDRTRRFNSVSDLSDDLQRYLSDQPILARPPSAIDRLRKFVRRNRLPVVAGSVAVVALMIGISIAILGLVQARQAAQRADREAANARMQALRSEQVSAFLRKMLSGVRPGVALGQDTRLLHGILDEAAAQVDKSLDDQPLVRAELYGTLGLVYWDISQDATAERLFRSAIDLYRANAGEASPAAALCEARLANLLKSQQQYLQAETHAHHAVAMARLSGDRATLARCLYYLGHAIDRNGPSAIEAEPFYREAIALGKEVHEEPSFIAACINSLASVLTTKGDPHAAEPLHREALAIYRSLDSGAEPMIAEGLNMLGRTLVDLGRYDEALASAREMLQIDQRIYPPNHEERNADLQFACEAMLLRDRGQEIEALLKSEIAASAANGDAWKMLAQLEVYRGNMTRAAEDFRQAMQASPASIPITLEYLRALRETGAMEEHMRVVSVLLDRAEADPNWLIVIPAAGIAPKDEARAARLQKARLAPTTEPTWQNTWTASGRSQQAYRDGDFEAAIRYTQQMLDDPQTQPQMQAQAYYLQTCCQVKSKRLQEAEKAFRSGEAIFAGVDPRRNMFGGHWVNYLGTTQRRQQAIDLLAAAATQPAAR